jgi:ketosteroid isomerase-like protein
MEQNPFTQEQADDLATRLFAAIAANDEAAIREVYAADATIWNNHSPEPIGLDALVTMLGHMRGVVKEMRFERVRTQATASGFIDQHVTHFLTNGGVTAALPSCMIADVRDGQIVKVDEYSNPADMAPLMPELMGGQSDAK